MTMRSALFPAISAALCFLASFAVAGDRLPPLPAAEYPAIQALEWADTAAARKSWQGRHGSGTLAVEQAGDRPALKFTCLFRADNSERVSWDLPARLDLSTCRGISFRFYCADQSAASGFTFYFRSGDGWYSAPFSVQQQNGWSTVTIDKADSNFEDKPSGWGAVDRLRISAWRGKPVDMVFYIADFGLMGGNAPVAVIRGESAISFRPSELDSVKAYTLSMGERLSQLGVPYCVLSDLDLNAARLSGRKLIILPNNPEMPEPVANSIAAYVKAGGKVISFYMLPPQLEAVAGITRGKHLPQARAGQFAAICRFGAGLAGQPDSVVQASWNIYQARPVEGRSRTAALWFDDKGKSAGEPAIVVSDNCIHMTHVLLSDDPAAKQEMLFSMIGYFMPELWRDLAARRMKEADRFGPFPNGGAVAALRHRAGSNTHAAALLDEADRLGNEAAGLSSKSNFVEAAGAAQKARALAIRSFCSLQTARAGEFRGFWCHSPFGVTGMKWDEAVKILADNGFTAVMANVLWAGTAYCRSDVLPVAADVAQRGDQLEECLAACRKYGLECHVWKVCWNMGGGHTDARFAARMAKEGRTQVSVDGAPIPEWLCPSNPENRKLEVDSVLDVLAKYAVDGIHLDYIRYPDSKGCFCDGCRRRFEESVGMRIRNWPSDVRKEGELRRKWLDFRRANIDAVVSAIARKAHQARPGVKISAAVFTNWRSARNDIGQDWKLWCERGYVDFVCPMDYTPDTGRFEQMVRDQLPLCAGKPCYPGIGLSTWPYSDDLACKLIEQVGVTRRLGAGGFMVFNYGIAEARELTPLCGLGLTRRKP